MDEDRDTAAELPDAEPDHDHDHGYKGDVHTGMGAGAGTSANTNIECGRERPRLLLHQRPPRRRRRGVRRAVRPVQRAEAITRDIGDPSIWIESGMQRDPNNPPPDLGTPHANPLGYDINRRVTAQAGRLSELGRYNWLKVIQAVAPLDRLPEWLSSNYCYLEMLPLRRYAAYRSSSCLT